MSDYEATATTTTTPYPEVGGWTLDRCCMSRGFSQHCNNQEPQEDGLWPMPHFSSQHIVENI